MGGAGPSGDRTDVRSFVRSFARSLVRTDGKFTPLFYRTSSPSGPLPKKRKKKKTNKKKRKKKEGRKELNFEEDGLSYKNNIWYKICFESTKCKNFREKMAHRAITFVFKGIEE